MEQLEDGSAGKVVLMNDAFEKAHCLAMGHEVKKIQLSLKAPGKLDVMISDFEEKSQGYVMGVTLLIYGK